LNANINCQLWWVNSKYSVFYAEVVCSKPDARHYFLYSICPSGTFIVKNSVYQVKGSREMVLPPCRDR